DQGVLALTGYRTPDPLDLLYATRGLGMRLASNLATVAPQVPEGEKGKREPGGGGGSDLAGILRSRFQSTAFFLGSVVTDGNGAAVARAKLPDNLTTFRAMAVAVTAGDRYGSGESDLLVTRPLVARPALPRFVRARDRFTGRVGERRRPLRLRRVRPAGHPPARRAAGAAALRPRGRPLHGRRRPHLANGRPREGARGGAGRWHRAARPQPAGRAARGRAAGR